MDNLFVFLLIFTYFKVPAEYQHRILFWGVLGALVLRGIFLVTGAALLAQFHFLLCVLGAFLVYTGVRMALSGDGDPKIDPGNNPVVRFLSRRLPITRQLDGGKFFTRRDGLRFATPLLVVLVMVETTDVVLPLVPSRPSWRCRAIRSLSTPPTCSPSWACGRCTSPWPAS